MCKVPVFCSTSGPLESEGQTLTRLEARYTNYAQTQLWEPRSESVWGTAPTQGVSVEGKEKQGHDVGKRSIITLERGEK